MQFKMTPNKLMIGLFAIILLAVPITTAVLPKRQRSENENRTLAEFPKLVNSKKLEKAENLGEVIGAVRWDYIVERKRSSYMDDIEKYFTDHLAGREAWVTAKNTMEKLVGKQEINGVYTVDGRMIQSLKEYDPETVAASISAMSGFAAKHPGVPAAFMLAPTSQEIYSGSLPGYAGLVNEKSFIDDCYKQAENMQTIDCLSYLAGHAEEYIFYRTDHHWTSLGAYYAYCSAAGRLGYSSYPLNAFNIETASSSFRGTLFSRTLDKGVAADSIEYFHLKSGEPAVRMTVFDGEKETVYDSLYVREFLEVKDKYSSFTGSNAPVVTIETNVDNGKSLLLIKDSYAHSLVPFLSKHYSKITMVDMRYVNVDLAYFLNVDEYSQMMFMFNAVSFSSDESIKKLKLSK